jgi:hypothetical protein
VNLQSTCNRTKTSSSKNLPGLHELSSPSESRRNSRSARRCRILCVCVCVCIGVSCVCACMRVHTRTHVCTDACTRVCVCQKSAPSDILFFLFLLKKRRNTSYQEALAAPYYIRELVHSRTCVWLYMCHPICI